MLQVDVKLLPLGKLIQVTVKILKQINDLVWRQPS